MSARSEYLPAAEEIRQPPHSIEMEQAVLGCCMIGGPDIVGEVIAQLATDAFYIPSHQLIFDGMRSLHESGHAVEILTFTQQMRDAGLMEKIGGAFGSEAGPGEWYLTRLFSLVPSAALVGDYVEAVKSKWLARQMVKACEYTIRRVYDRQDKVNESLDQLQSDVIELSNLLVAKDPIVHISEYVPEAHAQIKAAYYSRGKITGLPTGFVDFDRMTNGLEKGYLYVIGARPAMGKTSFALGLTEYIAVANAENGNLVHVFSLEMTGVQLSRRMLCAAADLNIGDLRFGMLDKGALDRLQPKVARLIKAHITIDHKAGLNVYEFRARARRAVLKKGAKLIIVDYLQMMHGVSRRAAENRQAEISECIQAIAETAKELQIPIVVLAQLARKAEDRKWGQPEMSDLRESGDIENYAHLVGMLWRPIYYVQDNEKKREAICKYLGKEGEPFPDDELDTYAQIIIAKQREGATGPCPIKFIAEFVRFESATEKLFSNNPEERQA